MASPFVKSALILLALFVASTVSQPIPSGQKAQIAKYADYNRFSLKGWRDWQIQIDREPKGAQRKGTPISEEHAEKCSRLEEEAARLFTAIRASEAEVHAELKKASHAEYQGDFYYFPGKFPDDDDWIKNNSEYYVGLRKREKELERTLKIVVRCYGVVQAFLSNGVGVYSEFLRMERGWAENEFEEMTAVQEAGRDLAHYAEVRHLVEGTVAAYEQIMPEGEKKLTEKELQDRQIHENAVQYHGGPTKAFYW